MNAQSQLPRIIATTLLIAVLIVLATGCANPRSALLQGTAPRSDQASSAGSGATPYVYGSVCGVPAAKR